MRRTAGSRHTHTAMYRISPKAISPRLPALTPVLRLLFLLAVVLDRGRLPPDRADLVTVAVQLAGLGVDLGQLRRTQLLVLGERQGLGVRIVDRTDLHDPDPGRVPLGLDRRR